MAFSTGPQASKWKLLRQTRLAFESAQFLDVGGDKRT
jgi:hypothetical protein